MDEQKILKGMWWIKGNEDKKFTGILKYGSGYVPTLEIFPKEYDFGKQYVPNTSTVYGEVFGEFNKVEAVTLLECTSENSPGMLTVGAFIHKQEFVFANCVAIGMLLNDDEIEQVKSPQNIYLTCPGFDEYSMVRTIDHVWKDNIPEGRAYRINDLEKIVYTKPEPIVAKIDIGTITISLGGSSKARDISSQYLIEISLDNPTPQAEVNTLIYSQLQSFISIMAGRRVYFATNKVTVNSNQTKSGSLSIDLKYGHRAHARRESEYSILHTLLLGSEKNLSKFATLFPKWRENFASIEDLAFHYLWMADQPNVINILQAFPQIESYVLERLLRKNKKGLSGILSEVFHSIADHFSCSELYSQKLPEDQIDYIATQLMNFRHKRQHAKRKEESLFSLDEVYAYIDVLLRSVFLIEMDYPYDDIDSAIGHWQSWQQINEK
jgi:hypothetical protein